MREHSRGKQDGTDTVQDSSAVPPKHPVADQLSTWVYVLSKHCNTQNLYINVHWSITAKKRKQFKCPSDEWTYNMNVHRKKYYSAKKKKKRNMTKSSFKSFNDLIWKAKTQRFATQGFSPQMPAHTRPGQRQEAETQSGPYTCLARTPTPESSSAASQGVPWWATGAESGPGTQTHTV